MATTLYLNKTILFSFILNGHLLSMVRSVFKPVTSDITNEEMNRVGVQKRN